MKNLFKNKYILFVKAHIWKAATFILGAIVVIMLTKTADNIFPSAEPVVVNKMPDTLKVLHNYEIKGSSNKDSLDIIVKKKINQLSQLNLYEKELNEYLERIKENEAKGNINIPNKIILDSKKNFVKKGYVEESPIALFSSDGINFTSDKKIIELHLNFFSQEIVNSVLYLRLIIYKKQNNKYSQYYFDEFYEPRIGHNFIRISNELPIGEYEFRFGIVNKKDANNDYPTFYCEKDYLVVKSN